MLRARVITAVVLVVGLLLLLFALPVQGAIAAAALLLAAAAWEWAGFIGLTARLPRLGYAALIVLLGVLALLIPALMAQLQTVMWLALAWWLVALVLVLRFPCSFSPQVTALCGAAVLLPLWLVLVELLLQPGYGGLLVLLLMVIVWSADIGAYFAGRSFGRVKLAPSVSPGKTWEGVLGGLLGALIVAAVGGWLLELPLIGLLLLTPGVAMISVLGDLTVSMFKRNAGLKDSGRLLPGHGGILDRVDSLAAAAPLFLLGLGWLGVIS
jgi:phosphatidate cytidylyltransferase